MQAGGVVPQTGITQSVARWCFEDIPLQPFCAAVAEMGLPAIDLLLVDEWAVAHDHGLVVSCGDVGAGTIEDGLNEPRNHSTIIRAFEQHIPRAAREGVPNVICFFGNRRGMPDAPAIENSIRCLRECAPIAEAEGVTILVEALNSKSGGHVDYIGDHMSYALEVIRAVDSPRVRILYDIYHMQIMEGIIRTLTDARDWIGHYHTGRSTSLRNSTIRSCARSGTRASSATWRVPLALAERGRGDVRAGVNGENVAPGSGQISDRGICQITCQITRRSFDLVVKYYLDLSQNVSDKVQNNGLVSTVSIRGHPH